MCSMAKLSPTAASKYHVQPPQLPVTETRMGWVVVRDHEGNVVSRAPTKVNIHAGVSRPRCCSPKGVVVPDGGSLRIELE